MFNLFGPRSVDSIISSISDMMKDLEKVSNAKVEEGTRLNEEADRLRDKARDADAESARAFAIAERLRTLIA